MHDAVGAAEQIPNLGIRYALRDSDPELAAYPDRNRPELCYEWDREMVVEADLVVADLTFPSVGVGIELGLATCDQIPVVLTYCRALAPRAGHKTYDVPGMDRAQTLQVGAGRVTIMALGLPRLLAVLDYDEPEDFAAVLSAGLGGPWWLPGSPE
jgi:nucleoside 2-deoxyribosyltransferase